MNILKNCCVVSYTFYGRWMCLIHSKKKIPLRMLLPQGKTFSSGISVSINRTTNPETEQSQSPYCGESPLSPQQGKEPSPSGSLECLCLLLSPLHLALKCHACSLEIKPYAMEYTVKH